MPDSFPDTTRYEKGTELLEAHHTEAWKVLQDAVSDVSPDLGKFVAEWAFGDIYTRDGLDLKQRQLLTLACLTTLGGSDLQIQSHTKAALSIGLKPKEITEAVLHCLPYVGFPRALNAMFAVRVVLEKEGLLPVQSDE